MVAETSQAFNLKESPESPAGLDASRHVAVAARGGADRLTALLLLRIYIVIGAVYGLSVVAIAEAAHTSEVAALPLRLRLHVYLAAITLGALVWPVGLVQDLRGGR